MMRGEAEAAAPEVVEMEAAAAAEAHAEAQAEVEAADAAAAAADEDDDDDDDDDEFSLGATRQALSDEGEGTVCLGKTSSRLWVGTNAVGNVGLDEASPR